MLVTDLTALAAPTPLLLDTGVWGHVMLGDAVILTTPFLAAIEAAAHDRRLFASVTSVWEFARQIELGAIDIDELPALIADQERPPGVAILPITTDTVLEAHLLPPFTLARDPSARFIAATARRKRAIILTMDPAFLAMATGGTINAYDVTPTPAATTRSPRAREQRR